VISTHVPPGFVTRSHFQSTRSRWSWTSRAPRWAASPRGSRVTTGRD